jgi:hypothetical protein
LGLSGNLIASKKKISANTFEMQNMHNTKYMQKHTGRRRIELIQDPGVLESQRFEWQV